MKVRSDHRSECIYFQCISYMGTEDTGLGIYKFCKIIKFAVAF